MSPIQDAIAAINALKPEEKLVYTKIAQKYGVDRSTLARRHQGIQVPREVKDINQQQLTPQQELELVHHIDVLTERRLPPTRSMIQNFASSIAKKRVSDSWVTRFIHRHSDKLTPQWTNAMDSNRHAADSHYKYKRYLELLHSKITEYNVDAENTYNMDGKRLHDWDARKIKTGVQ